MNVYQYALDVQDASNLSGVLYGVQRLMQELSAQAPQDVPRGEWLRQHPALILYIDKINDMMMGRCVNFDRYDQAYDECRRRAAEGRVA